MTQAFSELPSLLVGNAIRMAMAAGLFSASPGQWQTWKTALQQDQAPLDHLRVVLCCVVLCWRVLCLVSDMGLSVCFTSTTGQKGIYWLSNDSQFFQPRNYQKPYQNLKVKSLGYFYSLRENTKVHYIKLYLALLMWEPKNRRGSWKSTSLQK